MKGIFLIAIALLAPWAVTATQIETVGTLDTRCPAVDTCPPTLLYHENNCDLYYECMSGRPQLRHCKSGLRFSKRWQGCVKPSVSECIANEDTYCREGEYSEHECQCTKFYECRDGWKVLHDCPYGMHFSKTLQTCVKGFNCVPDEPEVTECREGDQLPHECKCQKYYLCKNGGKALRDCPTGMKFDAQSQSCVPGNCGGECINDQQKEHDCDCDKYYKCRNKEWVVLLCPPGYHFSPNQLTCLPEREARCKASPGDCPFPTPTRPWKHECDCRLYYTCHAGQKEIQMCPWGYHFDEITEKCTSAEETTCRNTWDNWL